MNRHTRTMLEALRHSCNTHTREHAIDLLEDRPIAWAPEGVKAYELANTGRLGGFIQMVMLGDFLDAYAAADLENQRALRTILGPDNDRW